MSTNKNTNDETTEQTELRNEFLDSLERRGLEDHVEGERETLSESDSAGPVDTLKANYELDMLNKDTEVQAEMDALQQRITLFEERTPEHVEALRAKKDALEQLKGGRRTRDWDSVRRQLEGSA